MDFETAKKIIEKYKPEGIMEKEDALKLLEYCKETECGRCRLKELYKKCPVVISLPR